MISPIVHHPFKFFLGPLELTGFGIAMMAAFGIAHFVAQRVLRAARRRHRDHERRHVRGADRHDHRRQGLLRDQRASDLSEALQPGGLRVLGRLHRLRDPVVPRDSLAEAEVPARGRRRGGRDRRGIRDRAHGLLGGGRRLRSPVERLSRGRVSGGRAALHRGDHEPGVQRRTCRRACRPTAS